jgi:hypothetical protein
VQPTLEIKKWFEALAGDWDTSENRERTQFFPIGCQRKGRSHIRLGPGGALLVMEGHSDGTKLSFLDTFQDITANSHTLVFAWIKDDGSIRTRDYQQGRAAFKILGTLLSRAAKSGLDLLATLAMLFAPADAGMWERRDHRPALRARHRERSVGLDGQRFAVR